MQNIIIFMLYLSDLISFCYVISRSLDLLLASILAALRLQMVPARLRCGTAVQTNYDLGAFGTFYRVVSHVLARQS